MRIVLKMLLVAAGALVVWPACTEVDPQPGQLGGPCRASFTPCDDGLVCNGNGCQRPSGDTNPNFDVTFAFRDGKAGVEADGQDSTILTVSFFQTANGISEPAPENTQFRMWVDPPTAGTLEFANSVNPEVVGEDSRVPFRIVDSNASATVRFTGCDKALPSCPRYASVKVAIAPEVLTPSASVSVENIGAGAQPVNPGDPDAGVVVIPTPPLPDGFGPIEKCNGLTNQIYLKGGENAAFFQGEETFVVDDWTLRTAIRPNDSDDLTIQMDSEALQASFIVTMNSRNTGEPLDAKEYDMVVDSGVIADGTAQFSIQLRTDDGSNITCTREMERRFGIYALRIQNAAVQNLSLSFVHGCDGGIVEGCFNIVPIEMVEE